MYSLVIETIRIDRLKDRVFEEGRFALKLAFALLALADRDSRRGKSQGISLTPDPGEETRSVVVLVKCKNEPHLLEYLVIVSDLLV